MREVAAHVGVSTATAARVLRDDPTLRVRPETRERVLAGARELRYRPNRLARGLRTRRSGTIAVFLPDPRNLGWGPMLDGIEHEADAASYLVALSDLWGPSLGPEAFARYALEGRIDGALVAPSLLDDRLLQELAATGMSLVTLARTHVIPGSVTMRDGDGAALGVEHLLGLGHRRIGHVTGDRWADLTARREAGYRATLSSAGVRALRQWVERGAFTPAGGCEAATRLLSLPDGSRPTAILVTNLQMALGVFQAARARGLRIPTDLSVVTIDDHLIADHLEPGLTSIRMPMGAMGAAATRMLLGAIDGEPVGHIVVDEAPQLVVRASTASPARR